MSMHWNRNRQYVGSVGLAEYLSDDGRLRITSSISQYTLGSRTTRAKAWTVERRTDRQDWQGAIVWERIGRTAGYAKLSDAKTAAEKEGGDVMSDNAKTVEQYADAIMSMVADDMAADSAMRAARSFTDLHDYCDANEYMIHAEVPYDPGNTVVMDFYVDVQDAVTERLKARP